MSNPTPDSASAQRPGGDKIKRFDLNQRLQHILLITSFTLLALTGLPQSFSRTAWAQGLMSVFGGLEGARKIHHLMAVLLIFLFLYHLVNVVADLLTSRSRSMLPRLQDAQDAFHSLAYLLNRTPEKPQYDRFDFRQKLEYWSLIWGTVLMGLTGLVLMFPTIATLYLPGEVVYAAKAAHGLEALLAIVSIVTWHMYNTHLAAGMWPLDTTIFTGQISRERIIEEHLLEYRRLVTSDSAMHPVGDSKDTGQAAASTKNKRSLKMGWLARKGGVSNAPDR